MPLKRVIAAVAARCGRIRTGLAVGFPGAGAAGEFGRIFGGQWREAPARAELPYADRQFEVAILDASAVDRETVREVNRVLLPEGGMAFSVPERTRKQEGLTPPEIYRVLREGFDILDLRRRSWWLPCCGERAIVVYARKKAWREHKGFLRGNTLPFTPFRSRT